MHQAADRADRPEQGHAQHDVGHLADGREGEPPLEIVLEQRAQAAPQDGGRGDHGKGREQLERLRELDAVDLVDDADDAEGASLDHRHRVQQRRDRRRRHHRARQPAVQRHQRGLDGEARDQQHEDDLELPGGLRPERGHDAAVRELGVAEQMVQPDDPGEQHRAPRQGIGEVERARLHRLLGTAVHDQRESRQRQQLVEDEEREEIPRHRDAHGGGDADAEEAEEPAAARRALEVADRVQRGEQPQQSRERHEQQSEPVRLERDVEAGERLVAHGVVLAFVHAGEQHADQRELGQRAEQVERAARADPGLRQGEDDEARHERRGEHRERQQLVRRHGAPPAASSASRSTPRNPSSTLAAASANAVHSSVRGTGRSAPAAGAERNAWRRTRST